MQAFKRPLVPYNCFDYLQTVLPRITGVERLIDPRIKKLIARISFLGYRFKLPYKLSCVIAFTTKQNSLFILSLFSI